MKKKLLGLSFCIALFCISVLQAEAQPWSEKMANSVMAYKPTRYASSWDYVTGTVLRSFIDLYKKTGNTTYYNYIKNTIDYIINTNGVISGYKLSDYNLDMIKEGCAVLYLYEQTGASKYKIAADTLRKQLQGQPRTSDGGFWHKKVYPYQMWQDGLYMGEPFYAEYSRQFNNSNDFEDIAKQILLMEKHARDTVTGLIYHGWDEKKVQNWANPVTGCSANFWGRAMGWYMMAIVDVLDFMPSDYSKRDSVIAVLQRMAKALAKVQDAKSGCWYQVLDQGTRTGNYLESSGTCMFVYSYLKAVRFGYIDSSYIEIAKKGYQGILDTFIVTNAGKYDMKQTCCGAGLNATRDGSFAYYISEPICTNDGKAVGPFILASLEMERLPVTSDTTHSTKFSSLKPDKNDIDFLLNNAFKVKIDVYSIEGKEIYAFNNHSCRPNSCREILKMSEAKTGLYIVRLQTENTVVTQKIIFENL
jgi:unsaturated rhamnogalacturonyl hydrolase